jgi:EmrB/QacA subfamily drug resistance transporter
MLMAMNQISAEYSAAIRRSALLIATLSSFLIPFMSSSVNIALPTIGKYFEMDVVSLSWVATAYLLAAAVFLVPFGRIADIHGRKKIFELGILIDTVSSFLGAISTSGPMLVFFRFLQGMGGAMIFGTGVAILTSVFAPERRGTILGINAAAVYSGLSLGPFFGGFIAKNFGWRSVFLAYLPLDFMVIASVFWKLKGEWAGAKGEKFDLSGSLIYGPALITIGFGFSLLPDTLALGLVIVGVLGFAAFVVWESKSKSPVLDMNLLGHNAVFAFSNVAALINYSATFAVSFLMSLYLQYIKGFGSDYAGLVLVSLPVAQAIISPLAGRLSDRVEPRIVSSAGMALTVIGLSLFTVLDVTTTLEFIVASLVLQGVGFGLFSSPNTNAIMGSVERKFYGVAASTTATMRLIGQMLSIGIAMSMFAIIIGRVEITPLYYPVFLLSTRLAFVVFSVLCFVGIFASLARGKVRGNSRASRGSTSTRNPDKMTTSITKH